MASLPKTGTFMYQRWLGIPEVRNATEEAVNGQIRIMPSANMPSAKCKHAPVVERPRVALQAQLDGRKLAASAPGGPERTARVASAGQFRILTEGILKPKHFPGVEIDRSGIWPD